jgi:hypothetical protein
MNIDNVKQAAEHLGKALTLLQRGPIDYYLTELVGAAEYCKEHYSPFKVNDNVILCKAPALEEGHGWYHCRHFLVKGAKGVVKEVDLGSKGFSFSIEFTDESYMDRDGKIHPTAENRRHTFGFGEDSLVKA